MTDKNPEPRVSNRMTPLAWIIIAVVIVLAIVAFIQMRGHTHNPSGQLNEPTQQPAAAPVMPQQSNVSNGPGPTSDANGGEAREANPSANEPGGPQTTGNTNGTGGANTTGAATRGPT